MKMYTLLWANSIFYVAIVSMADIEKLSYFFHLSIALLWMSTQMIENIGMCDSI